MSTSRIVVQDVNGFLKKRTSLRTSRSICCSIPCCNPPSPHSSEEILRRSNRSRQSRRRFALRRSQSSTPSRRPKTAYTVTTITKNGNRTKSHFTLSPPSAERNPLNVRMSRTRFVGSTICLLLSLSFIYWSGFSFVCPHVSQVMMTSMNSPL